MNDLKYLVEKFTAAKVLLVGDIMLDTFVYGEVSRISPEGPIPVLSVKRQDKMLGAAGNVLANITAMAATAELVAVVGDDAAGQEIAGLVQGAGASAQNLIRVTDRPTILKTRYIAQNQQLLRVDNEKISAIGKDTQDQIFDAVEKLIGTAQVLVLSDYGKGTLTPDLIKRLMKLADKNKVPVIVDPKGKDFSIYKGAYVVTPNRKELAEATNLAVSTDDDIEVAAHHLIKKCGVEAVLATRSEDGISAVPKKGAVTHIKTKSREVYDVSGAGDTVVAAVATTLAAGGSLEQAAAIANIAGGLAVAKVGTAIIRQNEILKALTNGSDAGGHIAPLLSCDDAVDTIRRWQAQGLIVGFTNGCFDIVHYGHVNYIARAREKCDRLVIGLNHDASVKILKGADRPVNDEMARAAVIGALGSVDLVVLFGAEKDGQDNTPCALVDVLRPDILMKGGDYTADQLPEGRIVTAYGGKVEIMPLYDGYSTTNIIKKTGGESA